MSLLPTSKVSRPNAPFKDPDFSVQVQFDLIMSFVCGICAESEVGTPPLSCCGIKYCQWCCIKTYERCHVCKKDELNQPICCDICGTVGNGFTIQMCGKPDGTCDMFVCAECTKSSWANDPIRFCSVRHFTLSE